MIRGCSVLLTSVLCCGVVFAASDDYARSAFRRLSYEDWASLSGSARREIFIRLSYDRKAEFTRKHIVRWRELHRPELTESQLRVIDEILSCVSSEMYESAAKVNRSGGYTHLPLPWHLQQLLASAEAVLSSQQIHELLFMNEGDVEGF